MQSTADLNLLAVLDALLQEGSVTGAARRLHLTPPAVSRALSRLRTVTGDPLLVRAGRTLVPTPAAERLRGPAHEALAAAQAVLAPQRTPSDAELERSLDAVLVVRTSGDAVQAWGPALLGAVTTAAPGVRLRFVGEGDESPDPLRDGSIDLDIGAPPPDAPGADELHHETLLRDTMVVVGRADGAFARRVGDRSPTASPTAADLAAVRHVAASRRGVLRGPLDDELARHGLERTVVATAPGYVPACALAADADLVCLAPARLVGTLAVTGLATWPSPVPLPPVRIGQTWHRRTHTDPARRWLRDRVRDTIAPGG
ncbi:LysR family transcriptional regulator [Pseudonocardia endophytica]|uniref:DNA-binding transcriptional LysR family regulator n=1 Tax=Pseudonocardia endophytica TaxID=401976 RepID=A0A4R1I8K2_PSEEN|nr:LysR family transcriptional regulator [Pseudonocardia endophytica]TCK26492.1 DNA-binding transcriptional LysR family regulator [Pseudonocardia endophytica]